ncbi:hypothetical protein JAAARDRAFT_31601 [Jaapia argillacea MUCL 33604]|uniref:Enhancer of mRNA-decapping protein 4 WD40 repeat region domain-containing protein n=1 Tax=Jaapia argillacea MUCL 33604 TaxID=933084 RepID=A0A067QDF5_9AGAM|nr:hypothetical protein JAAARDRAFT_31601 [Jaapia argillacea MUCL 33604]
MSSQQQQQSQVSPTLSHQDPAQSSSPNHLDSLFHNLNSSGGAASGSNFGGAPANHSAPATPLSSITAASAPSVSSAQGVSAADRQSALLSLLGSVGGSNQAASSGGPPPPQQVPTPPGSAQRSGPSSSSESQGKFLLEQLMGSAARPNYAEVQQSPSFPPGSSPPYAHSILDPPSSQHDSDAYDSHDAASSYLVNPHEAPLRSQPLPQPPSQQPIQQQQQQPQSPQQIPQPPSPPRKSMFEFVSPFDALASSTTSSGVKKKPVPQSQDPASEDSWTSVSVPADPKRKSVENLMDQLTRGQAAPPPPPQQQAQNIYDVYSSLGFSGEEPRQAEPIASRVPPPPLPPKPTQVSPSPPPAPRASPPRVQARPQPQGRMAESPIAPQSGYQGRREKENSPVPRGNWKTQNYDGKGRGSGMGGKKSQSSPTPPMQNITFDVSQSLDEIQAPRDAVKSTAIALVKVDSTFLPGSTIGATHWVAYAMTRGRIRVISRSSGDRTLLQLPPTFPQSTAVTDMAVYRNRLAGVTSDGGFVVWDLPDVITDDVPGRLLLCVQPSGDADALHTVKWHPKEPEVLAVASETKIYLINVADAAHEFGGDPIPQSELHRIGQVFPMSSPLISFDFDVPDYALATISEDSTLTLWSIRDKLPFWSTKVRGDDMPSSITVVDGGIVIGRRSGTVFQLLPVMSRTILSTVKFVNGDKEDPDMFGHANYDSRISTLWVANNRRDSMIALKINIEPSETGVIEDVRGSFERVLEFAGPKPTIHFVILTADADPHGEEAHAACIAAKVPPGELALVAFSVHSGGVDQVLIRKEWYDTAVVSAPAKLPVYVAPIQAAPVQIPESRPQRNSSEYRQSGAQVQQQQQGGLSLPPRNRSPTSEEVDSSELARDDGRPSDSKGKNVKGKSVGWKDKDDNKEKDRRVGDQGIAGEASIAPALTKEMKKMEDNLHTRIGRLIGKELDKQHQRLEEVRVNEQAADFARQEKLLKLISTELTKNTTRVVEMAVKNEVQNSVLPSLENITKNEVKSMVNGQISKAVTDAVKQTLPTEIERILLRPDVSNHFARNFSATVTPLIERQVKETASKTLIPAYAQQTSTLHQEIGREIHSEIMNLKKEVISWQSEAIRGQESVIRELEQSIRSLSEQVKLLMMNSPLANPQVHQNLQQRASPIPSNTQQLPQQGLSQYNQSHLRQPTHPVQQQSNYPPPYPPQQQQMQPTMHGAWYPQSIAAPQASHPAAPPPPPPPPPIVRHTPPTTQVEEWDDTYLAVLGTQDARQLRELLARSNPEVVMPMSGQGPLSQAVVLTLVHRLAATVGETPPVDESFKSSLWWLQRASSVLNTSDPLISPYIARVLPNVQQMLNTTKQRLAILPGGSPQLMDTARTISDVQDVLGRKPM